ncbi:MAG: DJ-1/PfpI family protein [Acidimicrobiales bacterium]
MQIAIGVFPRFTALDVVGPYQVLTNLPDAEVVLCAARRGEVVDDVGLRHLDISRPSPTLRRPTWWWSQAGSSLGKMARDGDPVIEWVRAVHPHTTCTASVCTGSLLFGAAGLLAGLNATSHGIACDDLRAFGATPTVQRAVWLDKIVTAAGVSAGIDLALAIVDRLVGPELAQAIQLGIEYDPQPPFDAGSLSEAAPEIVDLVRVVMIDRQQRLVNAR